jgi:hypothetical protein
LIKKAQGVRSNDTEVLLIESMRVKDADSGISLVRFVTMNCDDNPKTNIQMDAVSAGAGKSSSSSSIPNATGNPNTTTVTSSQLVWRYAYIKKVLQISK